MGDLTQVYEVSVGGVIYGKDLSLSAALLMIRGMCSEWYNDTFEIKLTQKLLLPAKEKNNEIE